jgi:hypothetical protein
MTRIEDPEGRKRRGRYFLIPAGVLLGLGIGLIIGYPGSGVLIGLGLGFLASAFLNQGYCTEPGEGSSCCRTKSRWISAIIGVFLIVVGISFVWAPVHLWPYIFGLFLIVIGLLFLAKNFRNAS